MYRYLFSLLALFGLLCPAAAQVNSTQAALDEALQKAQLKIQHSALSHEQGVLPIKITVYAYLQEGAANLDSLVKQCPVVRISSHYLLGSMACVGLSNYGTIYHYVGAGNPPIRSYPKVTRYITSADINGVIVPAEDITLDKQAKLFLVRINPANDQLKQAVENKPAVNLFVPKDPQHLKTAFSQTILNRDECWHLGGRECANVEVVNVCNETGCFRLKRKVVRGDSGDPVFGLSQNTANEEFLLGFNVTDVKIDERQPGSKYHFFSQDTVKFLKDTIAEVSPADWEQIKRKTVNEDYFLK